MVQVDYLIVGQGLAGSILAYKLIQQGKKVAIIDQGSGNTASRQATGLINPITGRRFVKSWLIDDLMSSAQTFYQSLSMALESPFYKETYLIKVLQNNEQVNDFHIRLVDEAYSPYLEQESQQIGTSLIAGFGHAKIKPVIQVDINMMLNSLYAFFQENAVLLEHTFKHDELVIDKSGFTLGSVGGTKLVFAEGYKMRENPYFNYLPIQFAKGEAIIIKSEKLNIDFVLNSKITITPIGQHKYYVGASYDWKDMEQVNTKEKIKYLIDSLHQSIQVPYEIVDYKVGLRPTVKDRRPLLGEHAKHKNMYTFNGMGTKGLSLSPYFADQLINHIEHGKELLDEVNIQRFHDA